MTEHKIVIEDFNPAPSEDYATLRRQLGALVTIVKGNNAQFANYDSKMAELRHEASLSNKQEIESLRKTNERLTNMIDADLQSENTTLRSHVESLLEVVAAKDEALQEITTLHGSTMNFGVARCMAENGLKLKPSDVELVEVGTVGENYESGDKYLNGINSLKTGQAVYVLKQKESV